MLHIIKYAIKTTVKNRNTFIWTFIFPIALATFMYLAFGNIYNEEFVMKSIPVAVEEGEMQEVLSGFLGGLTQDNGDPYFEVRVLDKEGAGKALENDEVSAIITSGSEPSVIVGGEDFKQEIVVSVINSFVRNMRKAGAIRLMTVSEGTDEMQVVLMDETAAEPEVFFVEKSLSKGPQNIYNNFFYAIFAMGCLFSSMGASNLTSKLMPGRTSLSGRLNVCGTSKFKMVVSEMLVYFLVVFIAQMAGYFYMRLIGIELTGDVLAVAGIIAAGALYGVAKGVLIGAIPKISEGTKVGICVGSSMLLSFLADLCTTGIKDGIERTVPIVNRISPAALISDSFMTIYVYEDYGKYFQNLLTLVGMAVVGTSIAIFILSRCRAGKMMLKT